MSQQSHDLETGRRRTQGRVVAILSIAWWVVSIGGVITAISMQG